MFLGLIDRLAGRWLDLRARWNRKRHKEDHGIEVREASFNGHGYNVMATAPAVAVLADQAAALLQEGNAKNYIQFDMLPRVDRGLAPVRVTVQWAHGLAPAEKAGLLADSLYASIYREVDAWRSEIPGSVPWPEFEEAIRYACDQSGLHHRGLQDEAAAYARKRWEEAY